MISGVFTSYCHIILLDRLLSLSPAESDRAYRSKALLLEPAALTAAVSFLCGLPARMDPGHDSSIRVFTVGVHVLNTFALLANGAQPEVERVVFHPALVLGCAMSVLEVLIPMLTYYR